MSLPPRVFPRLLLGFGLIFFAMTAAWSFGGYVRTRSLQALLIGIATFAVALGFAWALRRSARRPVGKP